MAWRLLRPWQRRRLPIVTQTTAREPGLYPLRIRITIAHDVLDRTTRGRFPCAGRDDARMLVEVLAWPAVGPRLGQRRRGQ